MGVSGQDARRVRRNGDRGRAVLDRIDDGQDVARLHDAVDEAVRIDGTVPHVGGRAVGAPVVLRAPVPEGHDDVPLGAGRSRRGLGRRLAGRDAVGPVGEHRPLRAEPPERAGHRGSHRSHRHAPIPRLEVRIDRAQDAAGDLAGRPVADLVTVHTPGHRAAQLLLGVLALRQLDHRQPPRGGIDLCGRQRVGGHHRVQIQRLARHRGHALGVDEAVAAHEDLVGRIRQVRQHVAPVVVGRHDADEPGRQIRRFGDHPDARLRALGAGHHAADVVRVELDAGRLRQPLPTDQARAQGDRYRGRGGRSTRRQSRLHASVHRCLLITLPVAGGVPHREPSAALLVYRIVSPRALARNSSPAAPLAAQPTLTRSLRRSTAQTPGIPWRADHLPRSIGTALLGCVRPRPRRPRRRR